MCCECKQVFSKPKTSLTLTPGGEGRIEHYRVSLESGGDRHQRGAPDSVGGYGHQHPFMGPRQQPAGTGVRAEGGPPVSWLIYSPSSGHRSQLPKVHVALRIEPSRRLQVRQRPPSGSRRPGRTDAHGAARGRCAASLPWPRRAADSGLPPPEISDRCFLILPG